MSYANSRKFYSKRFWTSKLSKLKLKHNENDLGFFSDFLPRNEFFSVLRRGILYIKWTIDRGSFVRPWWSSFYMYRPTDLHSAVLQYRFDVLVRMCSKRKKIQGGPGAHGGTRTTGNIRHPKAAHWGARKTRLSTSPQEAHIETVHRMGTSTFLSSRDKNEKKYKMERFKNQKHEGKHALGWPKSACGTG